MLFWGSYWVFDWFRFIFARYDRRIVLQSTLWRALGCNAKVVVPDRRIIRRRFVERCVKIDSCNGGPLPFSCGWKRSRFVQKTAYVVQKVKSSYYFRRTSVSFRNKMDVICTIPAQKCPKPAKNDLSLSDNFEKNAYLWLRLRYSASAKANEICIALGLVVSLADVLDTPPRQKQMKFALRSA